MKKPTDDETRDVWHAAYGDAAELYGMSGLEDGAVHAAARRALFDAGYRHAILDAAEVIESDQRISANAVLLHLESLAKEADE